MTRALCPQDGKCKFQPEKAIAFVKDVANITLVSTALSVPLGATAIRPRTWRAHVPEIVVTGPLREADALPEPSHPSVLGFLVCKMGPVIATLQKEV